MEKEQMHANGRKASHREQREQLIKKQKGNKKSLREGIRNGGDEFLADVLRIPSDTLMGNFRVTLTGDSRALVENYRSILEYSEERILLQGKRGRLGIEGEKLIIDFYTGNDMLVRGRIKRILLEGISMEKGEDQ